MASTVVLEFQRPLELALLSVSCSLSLTLGDADVIPSFLNHRKLTSPRAGQLVIAGYRMVLSALRLLVVPELGKFSSVLSSCPFPHLSQLRCAPLHHSLLPPLPPFCLVLCCLAQASGMSTRKLQRVAKLLYGTLGIASSSGGLREAVVPLVLQCPKLL